jgi:hypothetical protein
MARRTIVIGLSAVSRQPSRSRPQATPRNLCPSATPLLWVAPQPALVFGLTVSCLSPSRSSTLSSHLPCLFSASVAWEPVHRSLQHPIRRDDQAPEPSPPSRRMFWHGSAEIMHWPEGGTSRTSHAGRETVIRHSNPRMVRSVRIARTAPPAEQS